MKRIDCAYFKLGYLSRILEKLKNKTIKIFHDLAPHRKDIPGLTDVNKGPKHVIS
jgi:hypothetical protein